MGSGESLLAFSELVLLVNRLEDRQDAGHDFGGSLHDIRRDEQVFFSS